MSSGRRNRLLTGLPACLGTSTEGFGRLCELLETNSRYDKQRLTNHKIVKKFLKGRRSKANRDLKTAERLQKDITDYYSSPGVRRSLWKSLHEITSGFEDTTTFSVPSLEHQALRKYDQEFQTADIDQDELAECAEIYEADTEHPDWHTPVLAALPSIRADVLNWHSLEKERQQQVLLAAFSVASVLDDTRLLRWAATEVEEISDEFSFLTANKETGVQAVREGSGDKPYSAADRTVTDADDVADVLQQACDSLAKAALELGANRPTDDLFDNISSAADEIARLREAVLTAAAAQNADSLIAAFGEFLVSQSEQAPWLASEAPKIVANWRDEFLPADDGSIPELLSLIHI